MYYSCSPMAPFWFKTLTKSCLRTSRRWATRGRALISNSSRQSAQRCTWVCFNMASIYHHGDSRHLARAGPLASNTLMGSGEPSCTHCLQYHGTAFNTTALPSLPPIPQLPSLPSPSHRSSPCTARSRVSPATVDYSVHTREGLSLPL